MWPLEVVLEAAGGLIGEVATEGLRKRTNTEKTHTRVSKRETSHQRNHIETPS